jgi:hypothetical protein
MDYPHNGFPFCKHRAHNPVFLTKQEARDKVLNKMLNALNAIFNGLQKIFV